MRNVRIFKFVQTWIKPDIFGNRNALGFSFLKVNLLIWLLVSENSELVLVSSVCYHEALRFR